MINKTNWIKNNPVTSDDVKRAFDAFGKDLAYLKGHATRHQPLKYHNDVILVPKELKVKCDPITSHMDSLVISGRVFLASIGKPMCFCNAQVVENKKKDVFYASLDKTICQCSKAGYVVQIISCDQDFNSSMDPVHDDMNTEMDCSAPGNRKSSAE